MTKTQPIATIRLTHDFKLSVQKNKYVSLYDESRTLWSILFDTDELVASFATQVTICKCNLLQGNVDGNKLNQDLKVHENDANLKVDSTDSVELESIVSVWSNNNTKLTEVSLLKLKINIFRVKCILLFSKIENNVSKPLRLKLGKNKLPQVKLA